MQGMTGVPSVQPSIRESLALQPRLEQAGQLDPGADRQISGAGSLQLHWSPVDVCQELLVQLYAVA